VTQQPNDEESEKQEFIKINPNLGDLSSRRSAPEVEVLADSFRSGFAKADMVRVATRTSGRDKASSSEDYSGLCLEIAEAAEEGHVGTN
jgi:hypothetical protein